MLMGVFATLSLIIGVAVCFIKNAFADMAWLWVLPVTAIGCLLGLMLLTFLFLMFLCSRVDQSVPQEDDDPLYRKTAGLIIESVLPLLRIHVKTDGMEKMPKDGRFLLVCNHLFIADPGIVLHCFKDSQLAFVTKQENQKLPVVAPIMHKILCQPIDRENDRAALKTILKCISLLKEDKCSLCVFPEGYTSKDGKLHPFRAGVFKIAQKTNVPIVVCTIQNTRPIFKNLAKLKKTDVEFHLVDVIPPEETKGLSTVELSDRIYECMIADLGEEFRF